MKKLCKLLFFNIITIIVLLFILETFCFFHFFQYIYEKRYSDQEINFRHKLSILQDAFWNSYTAIKKDFRYFNKAEIRGAAKTTTPTNKLGILLLGCSFTSGDHLPDAETFHYVLSSQTNRNVYNLGISEGSPAEALYFLREKEIRDAIVKIDEPIEYVFYTYIPTQETRVHYDTRTPKYKTINNDTELAYANTDLIYRSYLLKYIMKYTLLDEKILKKRLEKISDLYFRKLREEAYKNFENTKFIILVYDYKGIDNKLNNEKLGINRNADKVIILNDIVDVDLTSEEYQYTDKFHPNEKAWQVIVPALVKELKL